MAFYEIPLGSGQQRTMTVNLGTAAYGLRFAWAAADEGGWFVDIADDTGTPIACGIPLVTGADLLAPYAYLGIPGRLWVTTDAMPDAVPTFANLGIASHLLFEPA